MIKSLRGTGKFDGSRSLPLDLRRWPSDSVWRGLGRYRSGLLSCVGGYIVVVSEQTVAMSLATARYFTS